MAAKELKVGHKAPSIRGEVTGGRTVSLADYEGRPLVLYFYPKDATSG